MPRLNSSACIHPLAIVTAMTTASYTQELVGQGFATRAFIAGFLWDWFVVRGRAPR